MLVMSALVFMFDAKEKKTLLELARSSILGNVADLTEVPDNFKELRGVFVTLMKNGQLRGCIGNIEPVAPIYKAVVECAKSAAYHDFRFRPVQRDEIKSLDIEISILSRLEPLKYSTPDDLLKKLNSSLGVVIEEGMNRATFLPQVWEELPRKGEFLSHLCTKAGLRSDEWRRGGLNVSVYTVEKFCEVEKQRPSPLNLI